MQIVRTIAALRAHIGLWRSAGETFGFVPTMGALHEGHLSLVRYCKANADRTIAYIFVNPTQFGPSEDFTRYPRNEAGDAALLQKLDVDLLYMPSVEEIYPDGAQTVVSVPRISRRWEGEARPGHFDGVATIVTKMLLQALPDFAVFGEKDYQQLQVIKRLARDLDLPVEIIGCPIVRDEFGLALSSRNAYLNTEQLQIARTLNVVLAGVADEATVRPENLTEICARAQSHLLAQGFTRVDYLAVVDPETLEPLAMPGRPARVVAAAAIGAVRLLDNMATG